MRFCLKNSKTDTYFVILTIQHSRKGKTRDGKKSVVIRGFKENRDE